MRDLCTPTHRLSCTSPYIVRRMQPGTEVAPRGSDLESVIATPELHRRSPRSPDYEAETRLLASLGEAMAQSPEAILRALVAAALSACRAGSAGISLIEEDGLT